MNDIEIKNYKKQFRKEHVELNKEITALVREFCKKYGVFLSDIEFRNLDISTLRNPEGRLLDYIDTNFKL